MPNFLDIQDFKRPADVGVSKVSEPVFNNTDRKIQDLVQQQAPVEPKTMSQEDFYTTVDNAIASGDFPNMWEEEIYNGMLEAITSDWIKIEWIDFTPPEVIEEPIEEEDKWFLPSFKDSTEDVIGWFVSSVPSIIGNTFGFIADVVTPKEFEWLWEHFREQWIKDKTQLQKMLWVDPETFAAEAWEFWAEVWSLFLPWWQAKLVTKFPLAAEKIGKLVKTIETIWKKAPKTFNIIKNAVVWAKEMGKFQVVSEWEVTKEDLVIWAWFWVWATILWGTIKATSKFLRKELPEKLVVSWLVNPADLRNASERIAKLTWKEANVSDVSRWLLTKGIKWDKQAVREWIKSWVDNSKQIVQTLLKENKELYKTPVVTDLQNALTEKLGTYGKMTKTWFKPSAWNEWLVDDLLELITKPWLTTTEINKARGILWEDLFSKMGTMKELATKKGWQKIWIDSSKFLDDVMPWFRKANKDIEVWLALNNAIAKKEARELTNQILSYMWFWFTWGWVTWLAAWQDPMEALQSALIWGTIGIVWGKVKSSLNSTQFKTNLANMLVKLTAEEKRAAKAYFAWDTSKLTVWIIDKLKAWIWWAETQVKTFWNELKNKTLNITDDLTNKIN